MAKLGRPNFLIQSETKIGTEWELMFLGKFHPAEPGGSQHLVDVIFAARAGKDANGKENFIFDTCQRGVGELPFLIPGSIWKDEVGKKNRPVRALKRFPAAIARDATTYRLVDPSRAATLTLDAEIEEANYKAEQLVAALKFYKGLKVAVIFAHDDATGASRRLLVPQVEIFRYMFCRSPRLTRSLFHATKNSIAEYLETRDVDNRRIAVLDSDISVLEEEAVVIAAIGTDPTIKSLSESGLAAVGRCLSPQGIKIRDGSFLVGTPYWSKNTKLHAYGRLIKIGEKGQFGNFVQLIIDDDMAFSFDEVKVLENKLEVVKSDTPTDGQPGRSRSTTFSGDIVDPKHGPVNEHTEAEFSVELPAGVFANKNIPVTREPILHGERENRRPVHGDKSKQADISQGEATGGDSSIKPADVNQGHAENADGLDQIRNLWNAALLIERNKSGWEVEAVTGSNPSERTVSHAGRPAALSLFPLKNGHLPKWACVERDGALHARLALIVRFKYKNRYAYTLDMLKLRSTEGFYILTFSEIGRPSIDTATVDLILNQAAEFKGIWSDSEFLKSRYTVQRTKHKDGRTSAEDLAELIEPHLAAMLGDKLRRHL